MTRGPLVRRVARLAQALTWVVALGCGPGARLPVGSTLDGGPDAALVPVAVYAHARNTLLALDPHTNRVTTIGPMSCVRTLVDIAVDRDGRMTGAAGVPAASGGVGSAIVSIDPATGACAIQGRTDTGPLTSLSYVPAGTLLPDAEALVGYDEDRYMQVDPATGALTQVGDLNSPASEGVRWVSSGDLVSVVGGGTYLTVKRAGGADPGETDRIVEVDPKTGALLRVIGQTGKNEVLGLGYWGGVAYGFTMAGELIRIDLATGAGTDIPIAAGDGGALEFFGAGTTTIAPIDPEHALP